MNSSVYSTLLSMQMRVSQHVPCDESIRSIDFGDFKYPPGNVGSLLYCLGGGFLRFSSE